VVSVAEATFLVACSIGRLAAPVSNDPVIARLVLVREFCVSQLRKVLYGAAKDATGVLVSC